MANEIVATGSLSFAKSGRSASLAKVGLQIDWTGLDYVKFTQVIGTSEEAIVIPADLGTPGWCILINRSADYEIRIRAATGLADMISLMPNEFALFRMKAAAPFALAITSSATLEVMLLEA